MRDIMAGMDEKDRMLLLIYKPLVFAVTCSVFVLPRCTGLWTLLGDDFRNGFRISSVRQWYFVGVILRLLLEEFHIFYVKGDPEVDSRPGAVCTKKSGHYSYELLYDV